MDLNRLERWRREDLEREARRLGIRAPQRLSRRELIERLQAHHSAPIRRARRFLKKMAGVARDLAAGSPRLRLGVPAMTPRPPSPAPAPSQPSPSPSPKEPATVPIEPGEPLRPQHHTSARDSAPSAPQTSPDERPQSGSPTSTRTARSPAVTTEPVEASDASMSSEACAPRSNDAHETTSPETVSRATAAPSSTPASDPDPELAALLAREPIQTRTMARILAAQGHSRRALAIYQKLLGQRPDDSELRAEAETARSGKKNRTDEEEEGERDECVSVLAEGGRAVVAWYVREGAIATARRLCGQGAELVLRTIVLHPGDDAVQRTVSERSVAREGQLAVPVPPGTRLIAAVGLRTSDQFVSIVHAPTVAT